MDRPNDAVWLLDPEGATEEDFERALVHWDELDETSLRALSDHPLHGRRLDGLQLAEAWLEDRVAGDAPPAVQVCPDPEELYDHARGPGARPLSTERRAQIDRHLVRCRPCEGMTRGLATRPPAPLEDLPAAHGLDATDRELLRRLTNSIPVRNIDRRPTILRFAPLAAAASLVAIAAIGWNREDATQLPVLDAVRGDETGALLTPAGPLLSAPAGARSDYFAAGCTPRFELAPVDGATAYAAEIYRLGGGALDAGELVQELRGTSPDLGSLPLAPGRYTWRAHATVRGLDVDLGAREFRVVEDAELFERLDGLRRAEAIGILHEAGYRADARRLALDLPPSAERDAYLDSVLPR